MVEQAVLVRHIETGPMKQSHLRLKQKFRMRLLRSAHNDRIDCLHFHPNGVTLEGRFPVSQDGLFHTLVGSSHDYN